MNAQIDCTEVKFEPNTSVQQEFSFSSFSQYYNGILYHGVARIKVNVEDLTPITNNCRWRLTVRVDNNPAAGTPSNRWETMSSYSASANPPEIDILEFRITNACATSPINGTYQNFNIDGDVISIIDDTGFLTAAGSCAPIVNGPGSYLTNYDEFVFNFDLKVKPGLAWDPGYYALQLVFVLEEAP